MTQESQPGHGNRIGYVILYVDDVDRAVAFYRGLLGLPFKFAQAGYAEFATEGTRLALYERARLPELIGRAAAGGDPAVEILFLVPNVDAEAERLRQAGVELLSGPVDRAWGHRTLHLLDPDAHVVELAQEIPRTGPRVRPDQS